MPNNAITSISAEVLNDKVRTLISGKNNYIPTAIVAVDTGEGWIYHKADISSSYASMFPASGATDYFGSTETGHDQDVTRYIIVKNLSKNPKDGLAISLTLSATTYNSVRAWYIGPGEVFQGKPSNTLISNIGIAAVEMDGAHGYPVAAHSGTVKYKAFAIIVNDES